MAVSSITEQVKALLERGVIEPRSRGIENPDLEAQAVFELIASNLLVRPKAVLYAAILAKNGLQRVVTEELAKIEELRSDISDLSNTSFAVSTSKSLKVARTALLQLERLPKISSSSTSPFVRYSAAIDEFLDSQLSKTVRRPGGTALSRPREEAQIDLASNLEQLKELHSSVLDRLYSLVVGVDNFLSSPITTILGTVSASRARADLEEIMEMIESSTDVGLQREIVTRLLTARASVKVLARPPDIREKLIDSQSSIPLGHELTARTTEEVSVAESASGSRFVLAGLGAPLEVTISVNGQSITEQFPQTNVDLGIRPAVAGGDLTSSLPIVIPSNHYLFFQSDIAGSVEYIKVPLTAATYTTVADLILGLSTDLGAVTTYVKCVEYCTDGTNRLLFYGDTTPESLSSYESLQIVGTYLDSTGVYTNSVHSLLGFEDYQLGLKNTSAQHAVDALNYVYGSIVTAFPGPEVITVTSKDSSFGTTMVIDGTGPLGLDGTHYAVSDTITLYGKVNGETTDPVNPVSLVAPGDILTTDSGSSAILTVTPSSIVLESPIRTCDGNLSVESILLKTYDLLSSELSSFLEVWLTTPFASDLKKLDASLAGIAESPTEAKKNQAIAILDSLKGYLLSLQSGLSNNSLPVNSAPLERSIIQGIIATLEERKFDRAIDLLLKCRIQELMDLDSDSASYAGAFLKASSDLAQKDIDFPNPALDEGLESDSSQDRSR